ncbi:MAG: hypothetical protein HY730_06820 [Candidatus Tectomicrobia bacterium]|uniref:Uncharacterized protein n=1 Tax=Tectimicrobiota bacterium TaxID=2528274 RepID=A0A933GP33_UNCTE|nr:hypothetical protein [Candidatus Tectomicrobia bacterium]
MKYEDFRDRWHKALKGAFREVPLHIDPKERIDLNSMDRIYELVLIFGTQPRFEPFYTFISLKWEWDVVFSARYATTEEDMLMQIFGDFGIHEDTAPPRLRMDVCLTASVPHESIFPIPELKQWLHWVKTASSHLQEILPTSYEDEGFISSYSGEIDAPVRVLDDGRFYLNKLSFEAWQMVPLPRQWDDPDKCDPDPDEALMDFAHRIAKSLTVWEDSLVHLVEYEAE